MKSFKRSIKGLLLVTLLGAGGVHSTVSSGLTNKLIVEASKTRSEEFRCLTLTLYHESRSEPVEGVLAVAEVILNRKDNPRYPKSICKVVKQQLVKGVYQFSFWGEKKLLNKPIDKKSWKKMEKIANTALRLRSTGNHKLLDVSGGSMYYHTVDVNPTWAKSPKLKFVKRIGRHKFYRRIK